MPGKESSGKEEKKQFFRYGLLLYGIMFSSSVSCFFCLFYPAKALHLHYFAPIYRTGNSQAILRALLPYGYIFFLFYPLFFTHNLLKIQGFWAVLLPCSYLLFILSFLPSSTRLFLENTGFLAFFRKKRERKRRMRSRFAGMGFLWIFFVAFLWFFRTCRRWIFVFYRKGMGKREENREFFAGGLNMETERKKEGKERKNRKILGGFLSEFTGSWAKIIFCKSAKMKSARTKMLSKSSCLLYTSDAADE